MSLLDSSLAQTEWRALLQRLGLRLNNSCVWHEEWVGRPAGGELVLRSPVDGSELGALFWAGEEDLDDAVYLAGKAAERGRGQRAGERRALLLAALRQSFAEAAGELAKVICWETGLLLGQAEAEVEFVLGALRRAAIPEDGGRFVARPVGVVGVITPWVQPLSAWAEVAVPALAAGNAVVWKPSSRAALSALVAQKLVAPVLERMGLAGLHALVGGPGRSIGERLTKDRRVARVAFAGSAEWGRRVAECAGARLAMASDGSGGQEQAPAAYVAFEEASPRQLLQALQRDALWASGQGRGSVRYLLVQQDFAEELQSFLTVQWGKVAVGPSWSAASACGPMRDAAALAAAREAMAEWRGLGAESWPLPGQPRAGEAAVLDAAGEALRGGLYLQPALLGLPIESVALRRTAAFPGLLVASFGQMDEVLRLGLPLAGVSIWGNRLDAVEACREQLPAGSVLVANGALPQPGVRDRYGPENFLAKLWLS